jgi:hypothetical protein
VKFLENQQTMMKVQEAMMQKLAKQKSRRYKVHTQMPDKFDGKIEDYVASWLEQFET